MLRHDSFISLCLNIRLVGVTIHCCKAERINCILIYQCVLAMDDSNKRITSESSYENRNSHDLVNPIATGDASVQQPGSPTRPPNNSQGDMTLLKKKPTSFQITSVTVQGSRLSTDGGEDSADDLDESHTEELSSDVLDISRTTDVDNDPLSEENSSANAANVQKNIPTKTSENQQPKTVLISPIESNVLSQSSLIQPIAVQTDVLSNIKTIEPTNESETKAPVISNQWQHRFKVVKIVSSQPFKRGRWVCMDFMDPPSVQSSEAKSEIPLESTANIITGSGIQAETVMCGTQTPNNVAHVYEIPPNESYPGSISVAVCPQPLQQPFYGIFLPLNNSQIPDMSTMPYGFAQDSFKKVSSNAPSMQPMTVGFINQASQFSQMHPSVHQSFIGSSSSSSNKPYEESSTGASQSFVSQQQPQQTQQSVTQAQSFVSQQQPSTVVQSQSFTAPSTQQQTSQSQSYTQTPGTSQTSVATQPMQSQSLPHGGQQPNVQSVTDATTMQISQTPAMNAPPPTNFSQKESPSDHVMPVQQTFPTSGLNSQTISHSSPPPEVTSASTQPPAAAPAVSAPNTTTTSTSVPPSIPDNVISSNVQTSNKEVSNIPSQLPCNHIDAGDTTTQPVESSLETSHSKPASSEETESAPSSSNTVAIDNKIEQAMDLVKSHLMFAVREEVDVLREKITELNERISILEYENTFLKANASQETLSQLNQSQQLQQQQQQQQQQTQNVVQQQNIQNQQQPL